MTTEEKLSKLIETGEKMRKEQNLYFKCVTQSEKRFQIGRAKEAEKEFDELVKECKNQ